jgi:uncharacterized membrane protein YphA (DoxX/SURF4 family)
VGLAGAFGWLVFVHAGLSKLRHRDVLPGVIANYRLLPDALVAPVAAVLPWAELVLGLALLAGGPPWPWCRRWSCWGCSQRRWR